MPPQRSRKPKRRAQLQHGSNVVDVAAIHVDSEPTWFTKWAKNHQTGIRGAAWSGASVLGVTGYQMMFGGYPLAGLVPMLLIPVVLGIAYSETLPRQNVSVWRALLGMYIVGALVGLGITALHKHQDISLITDRPELYGKLENVLTATTGDKCDFYVQGYMANRGTPSFAVQYRLNILAPDGSVVATNIRPIPINEPGTREDNVSQTMRTYRITPENALDQRTAKAIENDIVVG